MLSSLLWQRRCGAAGQNAGEEQAQTGRQQWGKVQTKRERERERLEKKSVRVREEYVMEAVENVDRKS